MVLIGFGLVTDIIGSTIVNYDSKIVVISKLPILHF